MHLCRQGALLCAHSSTAPIANPPLYTVYFCNENASTRREWAESVICVASHFLFQSHTYVTSLHFCIYSARCKWTNQKTSGRRTRLLVSCDAYLQSKFSTSLYNYEETRVFEERTVSDLHPVPRSYKGRDIVKILMWIYRYHVNLKS